jgi:hypothetical protein
MYFLEHQRRGFTPRRTRPRIIDSNIRQRAEELKGFPNIATTTLLYLTKGQAVPGFEKSIAYRSHRKEKKRRQRMHEDTRIYRGLHMYRLLQKLVIFLLGQWGKVKMNAEEGWQEAVQADGQHKGSGDQSCQCGVGTACLSLHPHGFMWCQLVYYDRLLSRPVSWHGTMFGVSTILWCTVLFRHLHRK